VQLAPDRDGILLDYMTQLRRVCAFDRLDRINWWSLFQRIPPDSISSVFLQVLVLTETLEDQHRLLELVNHWGNCQRALAGTNSKGNELKLPTDSNIPLRVGFISADFRDHSVARFIWPLFEHLSPKQFLLYGYSTYTIQDEWRQRFNEKAAGMRDVGHCSPLELQKSIQNDGIHILFDLTGFTRGSRTGQIAWRSSPVQISWLGYPGSSGLPEMDYLFLDRYLTPPDLSLIRERPLVSPGTTVCFSQIDEVAITPTIPELVRGYLTIGSLNNSYKITRPTIARWASVLAKLPSAHFLFVRREFQSHYLRENIATEFERNGINRDRIHFFNNSLARRHYLDCYNEIDISLDTYPVTGGTTTTDALWMGVPVVGLEGPNVHQRVCSAILHHAGHPEWVAHKEEEFVRIALDLASDQRLRIELRQSLRQQLKASKLCDTKQFAIDFGQSLNQLRTMTTESVANP
jgi:predicted O-linked N-acetylglucosamine transferase (SPINDLY family)